MVKIRLTGVPADVEAAADRIARVVTVLETSRPYPRRGASRLISLYLEAALAAPDAGAAACEDGGGASRP